MNSVRIVALCLPLLLVPVLHAQDGKDKKTGPAPVEGLKALKHPDAGVRYRAIQTLINVGGPLAKIAVPDLREMLKEDKHPQVRVKAAEALWKIDKTSTAALLPVLLAAMKDKEPSTRALVPPVIALFGAKAKTGLPALFEALKDTDLGVKISVITALGDLGPVAKGAAGPLLDLTADKQFFILEPFVGAALTNLGDGTIPILTKALAAPAAERRRVSAYALGSMGPKAAPAAEALAKALDHDDPATRQQAARALGKIGPDAKSTLPQLETALTDKVPAVRIDAALATWFVLKEPKHVGVVIKALDDESVAVRDTACQALAAMKADAKASIETVARLLDDKELRLRAIITLGEIGPASKPTAPKLKKLLEDKDGETQMWSAFALWQITGDAKATLKILNETLGTEGQYTQSINLLGEMGEAARSMLPTLVALYRDEDIAADRRALASAIKKIDPAAAAKLGIK
jgi:HEAT repeat protein